MIGELIFMDTDMLNLTNRINKFKQEHNVTEVRPIASPYNGGDTFRFFVSVYYEEESEER